MAINKTQHLLLFIIPAGQKHRQNQKKNWNNILILFKAIKKTDYLSQQAKICTNLKTKALDYCTGRYSKCVTLNTKLDSECQ